VTSMQKDKGLAYSSHNANNLTKSYWGQQ